MGGNRRGQVSPAGHGPGPADTPSPPAKQEPDYSRIGPRTLLIEGGGDKTEAEGLGGGDRRPRSLTARSIIVDSAAHCPQIEQPERVHELLLEFLAGGEPS